MSWQKPILINPLVTFRFLFGTLMAVGAVRFMLSDWIQRLYVEPTFFFKFYGFEWVSVPNELGCYLLYTLIAMSAIGIALGAFYRLSAIVFFVTFTYSELLDATNYLNHYYLVILLSFLLIFLPVHRKHSIDVWRKPALKVDRVPAWTIYIIIFQLSCVYFFAGLAKVNSDWLFHAMPMSIWLPERTHIPVLGYFFQFRETAYIFSYFGAIYDLTIWLFLLNCSTRPLAYVAVVVFHVLTNILFNIGLFPMIMMTSTLIFFSGEWHQKIHQYIIHFLKIKSTPQQSASLQEGFRVKSWTKYALITYIALQLFLPLRYLLYHNHLFWSEEGYRFSWRVMLVEKHGLATFTVADSETNRKSEVVNGDYLTLFQEKQMAIQPDFILQFAHFLAHEYQEKHGFVNPLVTVDAHVAMNGRISQRFIKEGVNLATIKDSFLPKKWVTNYNNY